jgi:hypothetical protein
MPLGLQAYYCTFIGTFVSHGVQGTALFVSLRNYSP